jgi:hypothetical protein
MGEKSEYNTAVGLTELLDHVIDPVTDIKYCGKQHKLAMTTPMNWRHT